MQPLGPRRPKKFADPETSHSSRKQQQQSRAGLDRLPRVVHDDKRKRRVRAELVRHPDARPAGAVEQDAQHRHQQEQMVVARRAEEAGVGVVVGGDDHGCKEARRVLEHLQ